MLSRRAARVMLASVTLTAACASAPRGSDSGLTSDERAAGVRTTYIPSLRDRVGVTGERMARYGSASPELLRAVNAELARRAPAFGDCAAAPGRAHATFLVTPEGLLVEPVVAAEAGNAESEACVAEALRAPPFLPGGNHGGFVRATIPVGPSAPRLSPRARDGITPARSREPDCVGRATGEQLAAARLWGATGKASFKFAIAPDGSVHDVHALEPVPPSILEAVERGVRRCAFEPGKKDGEPVTFWIVQPLTFPAR